MGYRVWYSTESFADYVIDNTVLKQKPLVKRKIYESDANNPVKFHTLPDHIKRILYLDAPDIIVEYDMEPIFSIEVSTEAGTGHNVFQRFARLAASVENNVPAFYIYPEAIIVSRKDSGAKWDSINPLIFKSLDDIMNIYKIPALLYYFPTDYHSCSTVPSESTHLRNKGIRYEQNLKYAGCPDTKATEMQNLFAAINRVIYTVEQHGIISGREKLLSDSCIMERRRFMNAEYNAKAGNSEMSPLSATCIIPTECLLNYLSRYETKDYRVGELLRNREQTLVYQVDAAFRGDPYAGALAAIDYLKCRTGKTFEERRYNLALCWGKLQVDEEQGICTVVSKKCSVNDFMHTVQASESKNLLSKGYGELSSEQIPRYYMQVRYGSTYSKVKHIRVYSYFADAILFADGALWRDA